MGVRGLKAAAAAIAVLVATASSAAAQTSQSNLFGTQLSSCMRNALIGAGVGAAGGAILSKDDKVKNAVIVGALGGLGAYFVCKYLGNRDQQRIEGGYLSALNSNSAVSRSFTPQQADYGQAALAVARPEVDPNDGNCRLLSSTLNIAGLGPQPLPGERYCKTNGTWRPAGY